MRRLLLDLRAIADHDDLRVRRIEIFLRGIENIGGRKLQNTFAVSLEIIVREAFERGHGQLPGQAVLRGEAQRKNAGQIVARVGQFFLATGVERMRSIS